MKRITLAFMVCMSVLFAACTPSDSPAGGRESLTPPATDQNQNQDQNQEQVEDDVISILAIGNSFSADAMEYLYGILEDAGYKSITLGNLYIGGCALQKHATNFTGNKAEYTYYKNTTGEWTKTSGFKPLDALAQEDWEYVTMQQASGSSGQADTYNPYLTELINVVKSNCPDAKLVWHMTWAYQGNSTHSSFPNYGNNQMTMYNAIVDAVKTKILTNSNFVKVIPNGTAVQNLRTSYMGDNLTRDGYHMSYDKGRYVTALTFAKAITGCDLSEVDYTPSSYAYSADDIAAMKEAANNACAKPYEVTESSYPPVAPDPSDPTPSKPTLEDMLKTAGYNPDNYQALELGWTKFAYYNSSNKTYKSTLCTSGNTTLTNVWEFVGTKIFEKSQIPNGSLIVLAEGCLYRPEGWTALDTYNASADRPGNVTTAITVVDDAWWGKWNYRGFNVAKNPRAKLDDAAATELCSSFAIYVPR